MAAATAALAFAVGGWVVLVQAGARIPVGEARLGGLTLRLEKARWLEDQMDHGVPGLRKDAIQPLVIRANCCATPRARTEIRGSSR